VGEDAPSASRGRPRGRGRPFRELLMAECNSQRNCADIARKWLIMCEIRIDFAFNYPYTLTHGRENECSKGYG
jgi:hypothetical protein